MELISIIMGVYNAENTINKCIESILNQSYSNWEFLICDDCSTDNTKKIINQYCKKDKRIKLICNEKNYRLAYSLNRCLSIAKGEYIARVDADDECMPTRLEKQINFLKNNLEYDVVGCSRYIFDEDGVKGIRYSIEYPNSNILLTDTPFAHPTILMRKSAYDKLKGYTVNDKTMRAEDLDLWFRFFYIGLSGYNLQEPLYKYREGKEDYKKRSLQAAFQTSRVFLDGYKTLQFSKTKYIYALKPIISAIIPNTIMMLFHSKKMIKFEKEKI